MDPKQLRAAARTAGRPLLRARHHDLRSSTATSPCRRSSKARPRTRRASAAATSSRRSTARTRRAGRAIRPCASCADRRAPRCRSRIRRAGYDQLIPIEVAARRDHHPSRSRPTSWSTSRPATSSCRTSPRTPIAISARALQDLAKQGMRRLLLDLRGNPGGPLDQAIRVSNRFLPQGRPDRLHARAACRIPTWPIARPRRATTRTCRSSCSSTATARARPRSCRARCRITTARSSSARRRSARRSCSRSTRISGGAGLALTTARYYTPSGRLIQRPWDGTFDEYLTYTLRGQSAERPHDAKDLKLTDAGRKVYARRRHRAGSACGRANRGLQPDEVRPQPLRAAAVRHVRPALLAEGDTRIQSLRQGPPDRRAQLRGRRCDGRGLQEARGDVRR